MLYLYFFALKIYSTGIWIASFFKVKAKEWIDGRKNFYNQIASELKSGEKRIWFHCSSFGEFEQGRPVLQALKKKFPEHKIVLTFFSPSGIKQGKKEPAADYVFYMPLDGASSSQKFIEITNPPSRIFVKYDYWFGYMRQLHHHKIPFYYVSCIFRREQYFFKWYGVWFLKQLKNATCFFVQDEASQNLLNQNGISQTIITGDTRFDRVFEFSKNTLPLDWVVNFKARKKLIVAGSTWAEDETVLSDFINSSSDNIKIIIVPHEISTEKIALLESKLKAKSVLYSSLNNSSVQDNKVLIVDAVGFLSKIYQYADVVYIGGGFGKGIHNILEAVVFGKPVLFGPNFKKFNEAIELKRMGGAFEITNSEELTAQLNLLLNNDQLCEEINTINQDFVKVNIGATEKIMAEIRI
ncbi:MAG: 3-deoxy-D-manno-octulosonic acid transferase [Bacteroidetes bacterium]|nr:3-deoxy-D-manno-octulosonic acid transferase [Bacteroidota bacterium]